MSFVETFKDATIGFSGYKRLLRSNAGGFGYFAVLLLIVLAISGTIATVNARQQAGVAAEALEAAPDFALQNGEITFGGHMPYRLELGNGAFLIIDTTGATTSEALKNAPPNSVVITKNTCYIVQYSGQMQTFDLKELPISVTKQDIIRLVKALYWLVLVAHILVYPLQLGFKALDACILALIAMAYGTSRKQPVSFELGFRASLYAMTLPTLIQWLWPGFSVFSWSGFIIWWGIAMLYLILGMRAYLETPDDWHEIPPV